MNKKERGHKARVALACVFAAFQFAAQANTTGADLSFKPQLLTGLPRLACEAILCLSSPARPSECQPSLSHYFSINHKYWSETVAARRSFLRMCPASKEPGMPELVDALASGAGHCDAAMLNTRNKRTAYRSHQVYRGADDGYVLYVTEFQAIDNVKPLYCQVYENNQLTVDLSTKYVGDPFKGGFWVHAKDYDQALRKWQASQTSDNDTYTYSWTNPRGHDNHYGN